MKIKQNKEKRLNQKEINLIRVMYETTAKTNSEIARAFNVLEGAVRYLVKKNNWQKTKELQEYYEAEKLVNKQEILTKFKSEQKQEDLKHIKSIADKDGEELAKREIKIQKMKQEMMYNAYEVASEVVKHAKSLIDAKKIRDAKIEDVFHQGQKTGDVKRTIFEKNFLPQDIEKLQSIVKPFLEADGFLHKPTIALQNNIQNNVNLQEAQLTNGAKSIAVLYSQTESFKNVADEQ